MNSKASIQCGVPVEGGELELMLLMADHVSVRIDKLEVKLRL